MKRVFLSVLVAGATLLSGCSAASSPESVIGGMLDHLYYSQGTYDEYRSYFSDPSKVISQDEFEKIRQKGPKVVLADQKAPDVHDELRAFPKGDKEAVVYWVDFSLDKSKDLHWNVVRTDNGWKIKN